MKHAALTLSVALAALGLALPQAALAQVSRVPDGSRDTGLGVRRDTVVADSIAHALELPRPAELEPFGRLARLRLPASIVAAFRADTLRRRLTLARARLASERLGVRDSRVALRARDDARVARRSGNVEPPRPDSARTAPPPLINVGEYAELGLRMNARLEAKAERVKTDPCLTIQLAADRAGCRTPFAPSFDFQFNVVSGGVVADRVHVNVDYDSEREFDASNNVSIFYQGRQNELLHRLEVGNVSFAPPPSRFITAGIPSGNYGVQALGQLGPMRFRAIAAQQKGNIVRDARFTVGDRTERGVDRDIEDYQVEPRRFFFVVDPTLFASYPNVDILDRARMTALATALPPEQRPVRVSVYRLQIGSQPANPNGPRFVVEGLTSGNRGTEAYELLRENVDYYLDQSNLWFALVNQASLQRDRIVVAYTVRDGAGAEVVNPLTGGTPDVEFIASREQRANLAYDYSVQPGSPAFRREIRSVYRIGGEETRRQTVTARIVAGAGGDQEKPTSGSFQTYLQMFGLAQPTSPAAFDAENRVWPRPSDPNISYGTGAGSSRIIRDFFIVMPSLRPFAREGLVAPGNTPNDTIYATPGEYLYSTQHPPSVYRLRVRYQAEGSGDPGSLMLGAVQIRRNSERLVVDGVTLSRGTDYNVDYELGRVTFTRPDTLFPRARTVTVQYEENPVFASAPTNVFGLAASFPSPQGELTFTAISQSQKTQYNRPPLGFEPASSLVAGVAGNWSFDAPLLSSALARLPFGERPGESRIAIQAELATSRPQPNAAGQAWVESFEGEGGVSLTTLDPAWFLSSRPPDVGRAIPGFGTAFDTSSVTQLVWQTNVNEQAPGGTRPVQFSASEIDPRIVYNRNNRIAEAPEPALWLTLYPRSLGFDRPRGNGRTSWQTGAPDLPGRRWRSIRTIISPTGTDLTRAEEIEFWALRDMRPEARLTNPTLVVDLGEISENTLALAPDSLVVTASAAGVDSTYRGRRLERIDLFDTERDDLTRSFNAAQNDTGIAPDIVQGITVVNGTSVTSDTLAVCEAQYGVLLRIGDQRANCTVRNNRLDEEDIDLDYTLNFDGAQAPAAERFYRYVADLSGDTSYVRQGRCYASQSDSIPTENGPFCWVLVRLPLKAAFDTVNDPNLRRIRALRLTMISGAGAAPGSASTMPIARLRLSGPPWLKRSDVELIGAGGDSTDASRATSVSASLIGTTDVEYQSPPGVVDEGENRVDEYGTSLQQVNERSLRIRATNLQRYGRAEAFYRFPEGDKSFLGYREMRIWARGAGTGWGESGDLQFFVRIGRDANNFYLYRTPASAGNSAAAWRDVRVDFGVLQALRARIQNAYLRGGERVLCTGDDLELVRRTRRPASGIDTVVYAACEDGYIAYTTSPAVTPPNLAGVQELSVGLLRARDAFPFAPADTMELWIDDIRLRDVVDTPGYAGQVGIEVNAGGILDVRLVTARRDPHFRQLTEQPTFIGDQGLDLAATLRLDRLLPAGLGIALPLTISHSGSSSQPELLARSDVVADEIEGLRRPKTSATSYALTARRTTPLANPLLGALFDNLSLNGQWASSSARSEYQSGGASNWNVGVDYLVSAEPRATAVPGWVTRAVGALPPWIAESELGRAIRGASLRWNPASIRFTSAVARTEDERRTFLKPAAAADDIPRIVEAENHVWRTGAAVELKPVGPLSLRWDATSLRDLRDYDGADSVAQAARREQGRLLGTDIGLERERQMSAAISLAPPLAVWLKPRLDLGSSFSIVRDPNARTLSRIDSLRPGTLPHRFGNTQSLTAGAQVDLNAAVRTYLQTVRLARLIGNMIQPIDVTFNRSLLSAYDDEAFAPGGAYQFALGGAGSFRRLRGQAATSAGETNSLSANGSLSLPLDLSLVARFGRTTTQSWTRRTAETQDVVDGVQHDFPDLTLRWNAVAGRGLLPDFTGRVVRSIGANVGVRHTRVASVAAALVAGAPDARISRIRTYPIGGTISWNFGDLTTSGGMSFTTRDDTLPGNASHGIQGEKSADLSRSWTLPKSWDARSPLRTRLSYQESRSRNELTASRRRLADNGRHVFSLSGDTELSETMTFSLQGSRTATVDRNYNRRLTQTVITAALQLQFFAGELK